jgi:hypothetical protein
MTNCSGTCRHGRRSSRVNFFEPRQTYPGGGAKKDQKNRVLERDGTSVWNGIDAR